MILKEAFRYQTFLNTLISFATRDLANREHSLKIVKTHRKSAAVNGGTDLVEEIRPVEDFVENDIVVKFLSFIVTEKQFLSHAITEAKRSIDFDFDAAVETNKARRDAAAAINRMFVFKPFQSAEKGTAYTFNAEGNQVPYVYDVEVVATEAYDRVAAKTTARNMIETADEVSIQIDKALANTEVEYDPPYDVNESYDDIIATYAANR